MWKKNRKEGKNGDEKSVPGELVHLYIHFCSRIIFEYRYFVIKLHPKVQRLCHPDGSASRKY